MLGGAGAPGRLGAMFGGAGARGGAPPGGAGLPFASRRSAVLGTRGVCASSQPLATEAGLRVLQRGGNAADAAVAMAAALAVTEPCSTGLGGDAFALFYDAAAGRVRCAAGNGAAPAALTPAAAAAFGAARWDTEPEHALMATVPGAAALWADAVDAWGCGGLSLAEVLEPARELALGGFPVSRITARLWAQGESVLKPHVGSGSEALLVQDPAAPGGWRAPREGERFSNPGMADVLERLGGRGAAEGFYSGPVAETLAAAVVEAGGVLTLQDLSGHRTLFPEPVSTSYRDVVVWEVPPPTHGVAALVALNALEELLPTSETGGGATGALDAGVWHRRIESMRLGFADALDHVADPAFADVPTEDLLSKRRARARAASTFDPERAARGLASDATLRDHGDTVYFCAVDGEGNGCSMINSNYMGFGTGLAPPGLGFTVQNRAHNFSLEPGHPNCLEPGKRPYHTIIPGLATRGAAEGGGLFCTFGVMGKFMQPQGHQQVLANMVDYGMDPQEALDHPRFYLSGVGETRSAADVASSRVLIEEGVPAETLAALGALGHGVEGPVEGHARSVFGRGQVVFRDLDGVLWGGSDPRSDGCAMGW